VDTGSIEFKIADTGIGIPRDKIQTIFDMFQQVDSSATRKYSGVGLGLYIVKKFTEQLGGTVTVNSELGKGSVFTVTLPLHQRFRGSIDAVTLH
jgi:signal transduction histidine kinase